MARCAVCDEPLAAEDKACKVCGTSVPAGAGSGITTPSPSGPTVTQPPTPGPPVGGPAPLPPTATGSGTRECPDCHKMYGPDYMDQFCTCGAELSPLKAGAGPLPEFRPTTQPPLTPPIPIAPTLPPEPVRPPAGTVCLVVYSPDKQPLLFHTLDKDVTLIGRSDPVRGDFPDVDLSNLLDADTARRVSRKHAVILRSREAGAYVLRPLAKNTGTQIEKELATELKDYELKDGTRIILGGAVRMKLETMK